MNKQRKVLITITYNEMGIIIDTKAEEVAQPEPKRGEWEIYEISPFDGEGCRCHECRFEGVPYWNFCPNCGADMRGEQDG